MWTNLFLAVLAFSAGCLVAGSFLAFISLVGVVPRLAAVTKTMQYVFLYENVFMLGAILGNICSLYYLPFHIGEIGAIMYGFFGGSFVGCLAAALSEIVTTVPILSRRIKLRKGMPYIVYTLALGKGIGSLLQFYFIK